MEKPIPYDGNKPFIFISYSHRDSDIVWPIIGQMIKNGYRVWYDDGIDPGTEWDEFIATKIAECGYFIGFISDNYIASDNCKDELNFARDQVENRLLIYIKDTSLPKGMEMRLGRIQAIHWYSFKNEKQFFSKLYSSKNLYSFRDEPVIPVVEEPSAVVPAATPVVAPVEAPISAPAVASVEAPVVAPVIDEVPNNVSNSDITETNEAEAEVKAEDTPLVNNEVVTSENINAVPADSSKKEKKAKKEKAPKKSKNIEEELDGNTFVLPEGKWQKWGIPGFRSKNKTHMVVGGILLLILAVILYFSVYAVVDGLAWYDVEEWSLGLIVTLIAIIDYILLTNYGYVQERLLKLHKLNKIARFLITALIAIIIAVVIFFGVILFVVIAT